jgi:hypothetical protein
MTHHNQTNELTTWFLSVKVDVEDSEGNLNTYYDYIDEI